MNYYQHSPLRGSRNIRLLWLNRSTASNTSLTCHIAEVSLDEAPEFTALSYSWESHRGDGWITCNSAQLKISANCEAALRILRLASVNRALWIDAICIDQTSIADKNQQIPIMQEIYGRAKEVVLWLGPPNKRTANIMRILQSSASIHHSEQEHTVLDNMQQGTALLVSKGIVKIMLGLIALIPRKKKAGKNKPDKRVDRETFIDMFYEFFSRSVFERMWCVQEVAVARNITILWGERSIPWDQLLFALDHQISQGATNWMNTQTTESRARIRLQIALREIFWPKPGATPRQVTSISWLLATTVERGATQPRDKVYALNGLLLLLGVRLPEPDYEKPVRQVYQEIAEIAMTCDSNLDILYLTTGSENSHNLPSWVPDFSDIKRAAPITHLSFEATKISPCIWRVSGNTLYLRGHIIDRIRSTGPVLYDHIQTPRDSTATIDSEQIRAFLENWIAAFQAWAALARTLTTYPTNQPVDQAFTHTLLTDGVASMNQKLGPFLVSFNTWLKTITAMSSPDDFLGTTVLSMLINILNLPADTPEQREFAAKMSATTIIPQIVGAALGTARQASLINIWMCLVLRRKRFFVTEAGWMGLATGAAQVGDAVVLFSGPRTPFLIREQGDGTARLVCPAYVEGVMGGWLWSEQLPLRDFVLV